MRLLAACFALLAAPASAEVVVVRVPGFYFSPREVVIRPGDTVRWVWSGSGHTVTEGTDGLINGNEAFHSPLTSSTPVVQVAFTPAFLAANPRPDGRYDYFCSPHFVGGMTGVVWVADPTLSVEACSGDGTGTPCPCGVNGPTGQGCPNSTGNSARLRAIGTASTTADTLRLAVTGAPEGYTTFFFQGSALTNGGAGAVFGEGLRCVSGTVARLGPKSQSFNFAFYPEAGDSPISVRGNVAPGQTRHYQAWYRDSPGSCGPPAPNMSNAVSITWH